MSTTAHFSLLYNHILCCSAPRNVRNIAPLLSQNLLRETALGVSLSRVTNSEYFWPICIVSCRESNYLFHVLLCFCLYRLVAFSIVRHVVPPTGRRVTLFVRSLGWTWGQSWFIIRLIRYYRDSLVNMLMFSPKSTYFRASLQDILTTVSPSVRVSGQHTPSRSLAAAHPANN